MLLQQALSYSAATGMLQRVGSLKDVRALGMRGHKSASKDESKASQAPVLRRAASLGASLAQFMRGQGETKDLLTSREVKDTEEGEGGRIGEKERA